MERNGSEASGNGNLPSDPETPWTLKEEGRLKRIGKKYAPNWMLVARHFQGKSPKRCRERYQKIMNKRRGPWSEEEDAMLRVLIANNKKVNWSEVAQKITGRSPKQCRERWFQNLDPSIRKDLWTVAEDCTLIEKQIEVGNKWARIATSLPGRRENAVKTRYKAIMRAYMRHWTPAEDNKLKALHRSYGANWSLISTKFCNRTKHAVKLRYRTIELGKGREEKPPAPGAPNQAFSLLSKELSQLEKPNWKLFHKIKKKRLDLDQSNGPGVVELDRGRKVQKTNQQADAASVTSGNLQHVSRYIPISQNQVQMPSCNQVMPLPVQGVQLYSTCVYPPPSLTPRNKPIQPVYFQCMPYPICFMPQQQVTTNVQTVPTITNMNGR